MERDQLTVTMDPGPMGTRILVMEGRDERMRALLGPATATHPRAEIGRASCRERVSLVV